METKTATTELHPNDLDGSDALRDMERFVKSEQFQELVESIRARIDAGLSPLTDPITYYVHKNGRKKAVNRIMGGHCRWEAAKALGLESVPVSEVPAPATPLDGVLTRITSNDARNPLTPIEQANAVKRVVDELGSQRAAAERLGWSESKISQVLGVLRLAEPVQELVEREKLPLRAAYAIASKLDTDEQIAHLDQIGAVRTVGGAETLAKQIKAASATPPPPETPAEVAQEIDHAVELHDEKPEEEAPEMTDEEEAIDLEMAMIDSLAFQLVGCIRRILAAGGDPGPAVKLIVGSVNDAAAGR